MSPSPEPHPRTARWWASRLCCTRYLILTLPRAVTLDALPAALSAPEELAVAPGSQSLPNSLRVSAVQCRVGCHG